MKKLLLSIAMIISFTLFGFSNNEDSNKLNKENLWYVIKNSNVSHPEIVFAQALLESGEFTSRICRVNNNLFGMKFPSKRETIAYGKSKSGYAKYNHWTESVEDYILYQKYVFERKKRKFGKAEYFRYLDKTYAEGANYSLKLKRVINEHKNMLV